MEICKKESGFSLIELLVVMIILTTISTVVYVSWSESAAELDEQTTLFINDLRYAQTLSLAKNERCKLIISSSSYQIQDSNNNPQTIPSITNGQLTNNISFQAPTPLPYTIIFDGKGVPYINLPNPATKLQTQLIITLQNSSGATRNVYIAPYTGKIST